MTSLDKLDSEIQTILYDLLYSVTNENLDAVVEGLDLKSDDSVLAVGGSGDQVFAILEYVKQVIVVDTKQIQLDFIKLRTEALKQSNTDLFFSKKYLVLEGDEKIEHRKKYFSAPGRIERISAKLESLVVLPLASIFNVALNEKMSKIYLSNSFSSAWGTHSKEDVLRVLENLSLEGLIYFTHRTREVEKAIPPELKEEIILTQKAISHEKQMEGFAWRPVVYRKVEVSK